MERELRAKARGRGVYWTRFAVGLIGVFICLPQLFVPRALSRGMITGNMTFQGMVGAGFLLCCSACWLTADGISAERREGTLGLLLLTRVKFLDLLFGKLGSAGVTVLGALLTLLPLLTVPLLTGGVTGGEIFREGLALLDALFFSLAAGLVASVYMRRRFAALGAAATGVILVSVVPYFLWVQSTWLEGMFSPLVAVVAANDAEYKRSIVPYWAAVVMVQLMAWGLVVMAGRRLREMAQNLECLGDDAEWQARGNAETVVRPKLEEGASPVTWRVRQQRGMKAMIWAAVVLMMGFSLVQMALLLLLGRGLPSSFSWLLISWLPNLVVTAGGGSLMAWAASRYFMEARRTGELELLLTTPLGARTVVSGQWEALKQLFFWPVVLVLLTNVLHFVYFAHKYHGQLPFSAFFSWIVNTGTVVFGVGALCWVGLWFGLKARGQAQAILWTMLVVKSGPMALSFAGSLAFFVLSRLGPRSWPVSYGYVNLFLQAGTLVFYGWLISRARRKVYQAVNGVEGKGFDFKRDEVLSGFIYRGVGE